MKAAFPEISRINYEGPRSKNALAFKHYQAEEVVAGKTMREHLRFAVVYWHTFRGTGSDPFGPGTMQRPWDDGTNSVSNAQKRVHAAFEFIEKLGTPYYCWHDRDVAPEGKTLAESNKNFDAVAKVLKAEQKRTGIKLLWGTASQPCFPIHASPTARAQAATPMCSVAYAAAQIKKAMEVDTMNWAARRLYLLGRTRRVHDPAQHRYEARTGTSGETAVSHGRRLQEVRIGWCQGQFYIEPKPKEPTQASIRLRTRPRVPELFT